MRHLLLLLLLVGNSLGGTFPAYALADSLTIKNTLLQAEYDLARKKQVYLFLNLEKSQFDVRASGMTVSTIAIKEIRPWGPLPEPGLHLIVDKDRVPEREKIQIPPPEGEEAAVKPAPPADPNAPPVVKKFDIQATEVTDMPTNYSLILEGGGVLVIKSLPAGDDGKRTMAQRFEKPLWKASRALHSVLQHYKQEPFTELLLILSPEDAQRLYWALPVGSALLIPAAQP
ncbi:MAG: hypothetical protein CVU69_11905 [Deltaproteobacteria bacterium HGW-Deltaproteobacteria-4]|nr:MAG: hypothetical protein CVU69_11905 [Deltaproteobacteria bacterium HGW-Deltaproteobacteria-4]